MPPDHSQPADLFDAVIVGAGFSGLCLAIRLRQAGRRFVLLEQAASLGGTWRDNRYPGAACDVPSDLYCYSFAPKPDWSRRYPLQAELRAYLEGCADHFGVRDAIRFGHGVHEARFDPALGQWRVRAGPQEETFRARCLIVATGGLSRPRMPEVEGLDSFSGALFHSARWNPEASLTGRHIGVIGTGASAIQIVPELAKQAGTLKVFQRTPAWVLPRHDPAVPGWRQRAYRRFPWLQRLSRALIQAQLESRALAFTRAPWLLRAAGPVVGLFRRWQLRDPALRRAFRPDYVLGCKRVLLSNDFYPAFDRGAAQLVTSPIVRILPAGIETADGRQHALDVLVVCTGFHAAEAGVPFLVHGRDGRELNAQWREGARAYLGTEVAGFPNLFLMTGPNTGLGHSSIVLMIEAQADYILDALAQLQARPDRAVEVRAEAQARYNTWLQARLAGTVWNTGGCRSWYRSATGLNTTLWPGLTGGFRRLTRRFDPQVHEFIDID